MKTTIRIIIWNIASLLFALNIIARIDPPEEFVPDVYFIEIRDDTVRLVNLPGLPLYRQVVRISNNGTNILRIGFDVESRGSVGTVTLNRTRKSAK